MIGKELECDRLAEFQIIGAVDFTHPAFAKQANDAIAISQNRPPRQNARRRLIPATSGFVALLDWLAGVFPFRDSLVGERVGFGDDCLGDRDDCFHYREDRFGYREEFFHDREDRLGYREDRYSKS